MNIIYMIFSYGVILDFLTYIKQSIANNLGLSVKIIKLRSHLFNIVTMLIGMYNYNLECLLLTSLRLPTCTLSVPIF